MPSTPRCAPVVLSACGFIFLTGLGAEKEAVKKPFFFSLAFRRRKTPKLKQRPQVLFLLPTPTKRMAPKAEKAPKAPKKGKPVFFVGFLFW